MMQTTISNLTSIDPEKRGESMKAMTVRVSQATSRLMKKKISIVTVLMILLFSTAFSQNPQPAVKKIRLDAFSKLRINAGVTVILIEDENEDSARIEGSSLFVKKVLLRQIGNELEVRTKTFKNMKEKGVIYIPVHSFIQIALN